MTSETAFIVRTLVAGETESFDFPSAAHARKAIARHQANGEWADAELFEVTCTLSPSANPDAFPLFGDGPAWDVVDRTERRI